ncbi:hypothetical protein BGY98DRAFT_986292 [Russula aff. rugulosa BPL654]|nr:hypothetical protein BGY98DRAFT_986292 [Russula aff. rugulosa BPL654]
MLSTRTKQVFSYGRRNRRIINDKNDLFDMRDTNKSSAPNGRRKRGTGKRFETMVSPSPTGSPPMPLRNCPKKKGRENDQVYSSKHRHSPSSARRPLSSHSVNVSRRSSLSGPKKLAKLSGSKGTLVPKSPDVNMDIIIIDEAGRRVSQERRVSKTNVQVNQRTTLHPGPATRRHATATNAIVVSDSDDSDGSILGIERRAKWWRKVSSSSDEEDCVESPIRSASSLTSSGSNANRNDPTETAVATDLSSRRHSSHPSPTILPKTRFYVEIVKPRPPRILRGQPQELTQYDSPPQPLRSKPRQLTPIRRKGSAFPHLPPSPSTITDSDISIDLANFTLSSTPIDNDALPNQPPHLIPLLDECGQEAPVEFSAFIEAFPVHPIVRSSCSGHATFQKIGEASYSEVFGIGRPDEIDAETPAPSDAKDVLKEIVVTRAMGEMCNGFVNLLKTYVIRGKYPSLLLDLWDEYNQTKGSESVRPDMLAVSQVYAIIVLPNGGPDLEAYSQACSLFWQIVRALSTAEELDLHWGQILVKNIPSSVSSRKSPSTTDAWLSMDHLVHGVKATVIDLGLARMDAGDGSTDIRWTPLDEEIFEGEGDYQFDIYRLMRKHNGGNWADFRPLSNVMWLHYLLIKLLKSKGLRPPKKANTSTGPGFTERQCYDCLLKMENLLGESMQEVQTHKPAAIKAGRRKMAAPIKTAMAPTSGSRCAGDVLKFGKTMGWV